VLRVSKSPSSMISASPIRPSAPKLVSKLFITYLIEFLRISYTNYIYS